MEEIAAVKSWGKERQNLDVTNTALRLLQLLTGYY